MAKKILYISKAGLPIDATGIRIDWIGRLFERSGYRIHYICERNLDGNEKKNGYEPVSEKLTESGLSPDEIHFQMDERIYSYLPTFSRGRINSLKELAEIYTDNKAYKRIERYCEIEKPSMIVLYNATASLERKLIRYCKNNRIALIGDVTEWYEKKENGTLAERHIVRSTDFRIRRLDSKMDGMVSISSFFHKYYTELGIPSILIPPLMDFSDPVEVKKTGDANIIRFVYAGSPGSKDIIVPFIQALMNVNRQGMKFRIDLIGVDLTYVQQNGCPDAEPNNGVFAHGRLPHAETVEIVKHSDFGILLRHNKRYAKAGFSTKFAECMSLGVAMICNSIGGTDSVIEDGVDGFVIDDASEECILAFLEEFKKMNTEEILKIRKNAMKKAKKLFNIEEYFDDFDSFVEIIR